MQRSLVLGGLVLITLLAVMYFGVACGMQRRVLYPRPPVPPGEPRMPSGTQRVWLGEDAQTEAWLMRPSGVEHRFPVVIFTHGNGELIDHWAPVFTEATAAGVGVLLVEYPGYGRSGGSPSESSIRKTILAAYDFVSDQPGVDREAIVAHGRSLGGGAACQLAAARPLSALVLESAFIDVRSLAARLGFPAFLVRDHFDNLSIVPTLDIPVLVLHGERDDLIPVSHGEQLAAAAETELIPMPCGHNDCPFSWPLVEAFLADHGFLRH
ncbi:MAG: alpha/beta fold hydrolase [bacterium]|nr:alpha/beta fold hydrolase [bacterium]